MTVYCVVPSIVCSANVSNIQFGKLPRVFFFYWLTISVKKSKNIVYYFVRLLLHDRLLATAS